MQLLDDYCNGELFYCWTTITIKYDDEADNNDDGYENDDDSYVTMKMMTVIMIMLLMTRTMIINKTKIRMITVSTMMLIELTI
jgi:hypothetical protein